jgi:RIO-like serine/threonine protein kinase
VKIGSKIGVGKESDVYICYVKNTSSEISEEQYAKIKEEIYMENAERELLSDDDDDDNNEAQINTDNNNNNEVSYIKNDLPLALTQQKTDSQYTIAVIKLARLGRTSFRAVKQKRNYIKNQTHYSWLYLSRLSAKNEYKYMTGLFNHKYAVPRPYGYNRHCIIMEYIPSYPLCRVDVITYPHKVYQRLIDFIVKLAKDGLIHGDFNEFNLLVGIEDNEICVIDFPQMISTEHEDAKEYFERDIACVKAFFKRKFNLTFEDEISGKLEDVVREGTLDVEMKAFGYKEHKEEKGKRKEKEDDKEDNKDEEEEDEDNDEDEVDDNVNEDKKVDDDEDDFDFNKEKEDGDVMLCSDDKNKVAYRKKYTKEDIKMKVKRMLGNSKGGNAKGAGGDKVKMGNRFKGKKQGMKQNELKHI